MSKNLVVATLGNMKILACRHLGVAYVLSLFFLSAPAVAQSSGVDIGVGAKVIPNRVGMVILVRNHVLLNLDAPLAASFDVAVDLPRGWTPVNTSPRCSISENTVSCATNLVSPGETVVFDTEVTLPLLTVGVNYPITTRVVRSTPPVSVDPVTIFCTVVTPLLVICG
ncbi:hypothetical protein LXT21_43805 [Myxococcus sp. K38C18041901]|uniref:hypothetical protein n=1 Tax=Myxococcus guangdongensis TaxID=2906760 RepID=UPI0020A729E6|nr:hypothetical protein [Myxococcus guangdongensis]MCP3065716.1 hypothetical protein [Myxococcus guangdongensis]